MSKWVYSFGAGHNEGRADMRNLLGGKGANLAEMASIGLPVPPGFTLTTEVCTASGLLWPIFCRSNPSTNLSACNRHGPCVQTLPFRT